MIVGTTAKYVPAGTSERKLLTNAGGGVLYYDSSEAVSEEENEGELEATESVEAVKGYWVVSASQTNLVIERSTDPGGEDFVTAAELATEKSSREAEDLLRILKETIGAEATTDVLAARVTGDTKNRYIVNADGKLEWGKGENTSPDANLYRTAADSLKTDDSLTVALNFAQSGEKFGVFGIAPAVRPEVKKTALTGGELATALATMGIVKIEA